MAKLGINTGSSADDGTGDSLRVGAGKINANFDEVYSLLTGAGNNGSTLLSGIVTSITAGTNISLSGGPTGAIEISSSAVAGSGKFATNSTGIHTLSSVGIGTTTAENNGLSVLANVKVGKGVTTLNLNVSGVTTFSGGDINISGDNYTAMWDASVDTLEFADNAKVAFGDGSDLTLYHDGSNSYLKDQATGNLYLDSNGAAVVISKAGAAESMADFKTDGPVRLFYDNVRKFETISTGATILGDLHVSNGVNIAGVVTANKFLGDGSGLSNLPGINTSGTSNFTNLRVSGVSTFVGDAELTNIVGAAASIVGIVTATGLVLPGDDQSIFVGTGNGSGTGDIQIYHTSGNSIIKNTTTGKLSIQNTVNGSALEVLSNGDLKLGSYAGDTHILCTEDGSVALSYDGSSKVTTDKHGAIITGVATATGFSGPLTGTVTGTATGLSGSPSIEVTNIVGAAASIAGIVTATTFSGSGASLTNLNGSNISSGTVAAARVATLNQDTSGTAAGLTGSPSVELTNIVGAAASIAGIVTATTFSGSGASLTSIPAGQLTGTVADARITTLTSSKLSGALPAIDGSNLTGISGSVAGVSTTGTSGFNVVNLSGKITGIATDNVIPFLFNNFSDLPSASTYHGAFAHVHNIGKGYFAHAAAWYELVSKTNVAADSIGVGTERVNVGVLTATSVNSSSFVGGGDGNFVTSQWTLGASGSSHYTFTGPGGLSSANDPTIYLARGQTYEFVNNSGGSHPFQIRVSDGGSAYNTGVTNNGASSGTIKFEVPFAAPNTLVYQCTSHSSMLGSIVIYPSV